MAKVGSKTSIHYWDDFNYYKFTILSLLSENNKYILKTISIYNRYIFKDNIIIEADPSTQELFPDEGIDNMIYRFDKDSSNEKAIQSHVTNSNYTADNFDNGAGSD